MTSDILRCISKFITIGGRHYLYVEECNIGLTEVKIKGVRVISEAETNISVSLTQMEGSLERKQELILKPLEKYAEIYILNIKIKENQVVKDQELDLMLIIDINYYKEKWLKTEFSQNLPKLRIRRPLFSLLAVPKTKQEYYEGERFEITYKLINNLNEFCVSLEWKPELLEYGTQKYMDVVCHQPQTMVYECKIGVMTSVTISFTILTQKAVELVAPLRATLQYTEKENKPYDIKYKRIKNSRSDRDLPIIIYKTKEIDSEDKNKSTTKTCSHVSAFKLTMARLGENSLQVYALNPRLDF